MKLFVIGLALALFALQGCGDLEGFLETGADTGETTSNDSYSDQADLQFQLDPAPSNMNNSWSRTFNAGEYFGGFNHRIAVGPLGNVMLAGAKSGSATFRDFFLRQTDATGADRWTRQNYHTSYDLIHDINIDTSGNSYAVGSTTGSLYGNISLGKHDCLIMKHSPDGVRLWAKQLGTSSSDTCYSLSLDTNRNIFILGHTQSGPESEASICLLIKLDPSGNELWRRNVAASLNNYCYAVGTDSQGAVWMGGETFGNLPGFTNQGIKDLFIVKFDALGNQLFSHQWGSTQIDYLRALRVNSQDEVIIGGYVHDSVDGLAYSGPRLNSMGNPENASDLYLAKFDSNGNLVWSIMEGTIDHEGVNLIEVDPTGNILVAASRPGALPYEDDFDIIKYDTNGTKIWTRAVSTVFDDGMTGLALDSMGNYYFGHQTGQDVTIEKNYGGMP